MSTGNTCISGYDAFLEFVASLKGCEVVNFYFIGSKDSSGKSWCPGCVHAEPHVKAAVAKYAENGARFVYVDVGNRTTWKDPKCPFRTNKDTRLMVIPTLLRWKGPQRLEGAQCENPDLLEMFFAD